MSRVIRTAAITILAVAGLTSAAAPSSAAAAAASSWLIKGQDWFPNGSDIGIAAQAKKDGVTLPKPTWMLCGSWHKKIYGLSDYTTCQQGSVLVTEAYNRLRQAIRDGVFTQLHMRYAVYDIESWSFTSPAEKANPVYWIGKALKLAHQHHISLIVSPGGKLGRCAACWTTAAEHGAYMVAVQSQGQATLARFRSFMGKAAKVIRQASVRAKTRTLVMAGLGTNTPVVHQASLLRQEYKYARSIGVNRFWLNANNWMGRNRCNRSEGGPGCPQIAVQFFRDIGLAG